MKYASSRVAASFAALMVTFVLSACGEIEPSDETDSRSQSETSEDETPAPRPHSRYSGGSGTPDTSTREVGTYAPGLGKSDLDPGGEERIKRPPE